MWMKRLRKEKSSKLRNQPEGLLETLNSMEKLPINFQIKFLQRIFKACHLLA